VIFISDVYQYELAMKTFCCNIHIQCDFFTLDNPKYWVFNLDYYDMEKRLDYKFITYVEGDTDSLYIAIRVDKNEDINQSLKYMITKEAFYN
jgi:low affinity Fe/Cu permease